jgi:hypothetical protein
MDPKSLRAIEKKREGAENVEKKTAIPNLVIVLEGKWLPG